MDPALKKLKRLPSTGEGPPMNFQQKPLEEVDFAIVELLFIKTFPTIPKEDLYISWEFRSRKHSVAIVLSDKLVGFVICSYHRSSGRSLYVDYFALEPDYRGSGLGTQLLLQLVTEAFDSNSSIHLYPARGQLISWYERNGFRKTHGGYYVFHSYKTRSQNKVHDMLGL
jgi:ribosomal protein S18 acetylase RimI-like enzyme